MSAAVERISPRPLSSLMPFVTFLALFLIYAYVWLGLGNDPTGLDHLALLCLVQLTPLVFCAVRGGYNYIALVGLLHCVSYSLPKYNQYFLVDQVSAFDVQSNMAIAELTRSTLLMFTSYFLIRQLFFSGNRRNESSPYLCLTRQGLIWLMGAIIFTQMFYDLIPQQLMSLTGPAGSAMIVLLFTCVAPGEERFLLHCKLFFGLVCVVSFMRLGSLGMIFGLGMNLFIISVIQKRYRNIFFLVLLGIASAAIQSVKGDYRGLIYANPGASATERLTFLAGLLEARYFSPDAPALSAVPEDDEDAPHVKKEDSADGLLGGFARLGDDSLERVLDKTPGEVPYWNGSSYLPLLFLGIPRAVWPGKPARTLWHDFGVKYGYLYDGDESTSISVSFFAEGYMNYGFLGLYGVSLLMGAVIAMLEWGSTIFLGRYFYFTYASILFPLTVYAEDVGSILMSLVIQLGLLLLARRKLLQLVPR